MSTAGWVLVLLVALVAVFACGFLACVRMIPTLLARWSPEQIDTLASKVAARRAESER